MRSDTNLLVAQDTAFGIFTSSQVDNFIGQNVFLRILLDWGARALPIWKYDFSIDAVIKEFAEGTSNCMLVKFQFRHGYEMMGRVIQRIRNPQIKHRIIILWAPPAIHLDWFLKKYPGGWSDMTIKSGMKEDPANIENITKHLREVWINMHDKIMKIVECAKETGSDVAVEIRDASNLYYRQLTLNEIRLEKC